MFEVVYFSRSGNTKKVADAIASELKVTAKDVKTTGTVPGDAFIFLGTGCYGGTLPKELELFLKINKFQNRKIALFTTSGFGSAAERNLIEKQLKDRGAVITHNYKCYGRFMGMKKEHPTAEELDNARFFARAVAVTLFPQRSDRPKAASVSR